MYSDPNVREREIKNMSNVYSSLKTNILPQLRRARFITNVEYTNYTAEELLLIAVVGLTAGVAALFGHTLFGWNLTDAGLFDGWWRDSVAEHAPLMLPVLTSVFFKVSLLLTCFLPFVGMLYGGIMMLFGMIACKVLDLTVGQSKVEIFGESFKMLENPTVGLSTAIGATVVLIIAGTVAGIFMRDATRWYALLFNKYYGRKGSVFTPRFGSASKVGDKKVRTAIAYLYNNPVERKICVRAEAYRWNFLAYAGRYPFGLRRRTCRTRGQQSESGGADRRP